MSSRALAYPASMPVLRRFELVTKRSSPTICTFFPTFLVNAYVVSKSFSWNGSSMLTSGNRPMTDP